MLSLKNITKIYSRKQSDDDVVALNDISLDLPDKGFVAILGASGSGKTTLLNIIGGLDKATSGNMIVDGLSTKDFSEKEWDAYRNQKIGFVLQNCYLLPHLTVKDNVAIRLQISHSNSKDIDKQVDEALKQVDLLDKKFDKPTALSGGQKQRVAIARALVGDPTVILADEPTGALDSKTGTSIMELLKEASKGHLVVMVTHNNEYASKYADRIIELKDGKIISDSSYIKNELVKEPKGLGRASIPTKTTLKWGFKNLIVRKFSTISIIIAAALGLTGVSMILSVSSAVQHVFDQVEADSFSKVPIQYTTFTSRDTLWDQSQYPPYTPEPIVIPDYSSFSLQYHENYMSESFLSYMRAMPEDYYIGCLESSSTNFHLYTQRTEGGYSEVSSSYFTKGVKDISFIDRQYDCLIGDFPREKNDLALIVDSRNRVSITTLYNLGFDFNTKEVSDVTFSFDEVLNRKFKYIPNESIEHPDISFYSKDEENDIFIQTSKKAEYLYNNSPQEYELKITGILRPKESYENDVPLSQGVIYTPAFEKMLLKNANNSSVVKAQKEAGRDTTVKILVDEIDDSSEYEQLTVSEAISKIESLNLSRASSNYPRIFVDNGKFYETSGVVVKKNKWSDKFGNGEIYIYDTPITSEEDRENIESTCLYAVRITDKNAFKNIIENETSVKVCGPLSAFVRFKNNVPYVASRNVGDIRNVLDGRGFSYNETLSQVYYYERSLQSLGALEKVTRISYYTEDYASRVKINDYFKNYVFDLSVEPTGVYKSDGLENASAQFDGALSLMTTVLYVFAIVSVIVSAILNAILTFISVRQRTNEIGLLRSLGARRKDIAIMVETESIICGLFGGLLSIVVALIIIGPVNKFITTAIYKYKFYLIYQVQFELEGYQWWVAPICVGIAIATALVSALIPAIIASKKDPAKAINE